MQILLLVKITNWFLSIIILIIIVYLLINQAKKRRLKKLRKTLQDNWGKPKQKEYYNFELIQQYFVNTKHKNNAYHIISDRTKNDIDFDELFKFIDRTSSKIGQQFLYYKMRTINTIKDLVNFDKLSQLFIEKPEFRLNIQMELAKLNSYNSYDLEQLIHKTIIQKPKYVKFLLPLAISSLVTLILGFFYPVFFLILMLIFFINMVLHLKNKDNINLYISGVNQLIIALKVSKYLASQQEIKAHFNSFDFIKNLSTIKLKAQFIAFEKHLTNEFLAIIWYVIEILKILFNLESILFYRLIDDVVKKSKHIDKLFQFIGEIDCAIATASVKISNETCKPTFNTDNVLAVKGLSHPLIANCVTNDIELLQKSLLLTGSNMSGKTTFIRTLAVNSVLAQTLNFAFADVFNIPFFKIYSSIRISDDLLEDTSYYLKEVLTIKELVDASEGNEPCLFVLDEIFKGTNTIERVSGGKAILAYLNKKQHFVFVSTHDIELTDLLKEYNYELYHFTEKVVNDELLFDHKLKKGKLKTRNAIKILELYNYPKILIKDAREAEQNNFD